MRTTFIALITLSLLALTGCKYPDTVQTHDYVKEDFGGDIKWHPYVVEDYNDFQNWAMGLGKCNDTKEPGPELAAQDE